MSISMVGRILTSLRPARSADRACAAAREAAPRPGGTSLGPAQNPRIVRWKSPATWCSLDTMDLRPSPGVILKQFTARDMVSRWDVIEVHRRATSSAATLFLDTLQRRLPFLLRALQVDGGSEFAALFETACQQRGLRPFVLPPRSPKLNGQVERANRTHTDEFYEVAPARSRLPGSTASIRLGNTPTTPSALTKPWPTSLPMSSWLKPHPIQNSLSVTDLLDEYNLLTPKGR